MKSLIVVLMLCSSYSFAQYDPDSGWSDGGMDSDWGDNQECSGSIASCSGGDGGPAAPANCPQADTPLVCNKTIDKIPDNVTCGAHTEAVTGIPFANSSICTYASTTSMVTTATCTIPRTCDPCAGEVCLNGATAASNGAYSK